VLFGRGEKSHKLVCGWAKVANAAIGGQGTDVEQYSGGTLEFHGSIITATGQIPNQGDPQSL
jgi:hypothetical protein